jgi:hypothetical protein
MRAPVHFLGVAVAVGLTASLVAQAPKKATRAKATSPKQPGLHLKQVEQLISIRTPDSIVAQEIRGRGVLETVSKQVVETLRQRGAGPQTLSALRNLIPRATLVLKTTPGAEVTLDDVAAGVADTNGQLTISGAYPGAHTIEIAKVNFRARKTTVQLPPNRTTSLDETLEWAVGFLTVSTEPAGARIEVTGGITEAGRISHRAVPIGQVTVTATAPLRKTAAQNVLIEPGKESSLALALPLDPVALTAAANQIHRSFQSGAYQLVVRQSTQYLQAGVRDKDVLAEVALSNLQLLRVTEFSSLGREALVAGATLRFPVRHHHGGFNAGLHPAVLVVTARTLGFEPSGRCNFPAFEVAWNQVARLDNPESLVLKITVPNPSNPKKHSSMNFLPEENSRVPIQAIFEFMSAVMSQYH